MKKSMVIGIVSFVAGLGVGGACGYLCARRKNEKESEENAMIDIEEHNSLPKKEETVEEYYERYVKESENLEEEESDNEDSYEEPTEDWLRVATPEDRARVATDKFIQNVFEEYGGSKKITPKRTGVAKPYVITPEEFGSIEEYDLVSLTYTSDGYLLDQGNDIITQFSSLIGDALQHIGEYENDSVHVRNDTRMCDYEILLDLRSYNEILAEE